MAAGRLDWEDEFAPQILERGYDYYQRGLVGKLSRRGEQVKAIVSGSEDYEVLLGFDDGQLVEAACSCPYAEDGSYCKHMAAVCFALGNEPAQANRDDASRGDFQRLVKQLHTAMPQAANRKVYRGLIGYLKKVATYPDGKSAAQDLARHWRQSFPRRSSMIDELNKAGF